APMDHVLRLTRLSRLTGPTMQDLPRTSLWSAINWACLSLSLSRRLSHLILISAARLLTFRFPAFGGRCETHKNTSPPALGIEDRTHHPSLVPVPVEMAVFEFKARLPTAFRAKSHLDLRLQSEVIAPVRGDLPSEYKSTRRLPREHATPHAFRAVDAALVPPTSDARFDHNRGCCNLADVVSVQRPPGAVFFRENTEG